MTRYLAKLYVGEFIELTIGHNGTVLLCIFGSPYNRGGSASVLHKLLCFSDGIEELLIRLLVLRKILLVGSWFSFFISVGFEQFFDFLFVVSCVHYDRSISLVLWQYHNVFVCIKALYYLFFLVR